jgi:small subunit ribosomal protein S13
MFHLTEFKNNTRIDNIYRSYKKRYGIGNSISLLLCAHSGYHPKTKSNSIPFTYINDNLKKLLINKQDLFSLSLKKTMEDNLIKQVKLNTYQGSNIRSGLPIRGQRRRTNANTARKLLSKIVFRVRKV